jgi:hypothetical protein
VPELLLKHKVVVNRQAFAANGFTTAVITLKNGKYEITARRPRRPAHALVPDNLCAGNPLDDLGRGRRKKQ